MKLPGEEGAAIKSLTICKTDKTAVPMQGVTAIGPPWTEKNNPRQLYFCKANNGCAHQHNFGGAKICADGLLIEKKSGGKPEKEGK